MYILILLLIIVATHGLNTERWSQACQFDKLSSAKDEIIQKCSDGTEEQHRDCSNPIMQEAQEQIKNECCKKCYQCSGCENDQKASTAEYELDSPGQVPEQSMSMPVPSKPVKEDMQEQVKNKIKDSLVGFGKNKLRNKD